MRIWLPQCFETGKSQQVDLIQRNVPPIGSSKLAYPRPVAEWRLRRREPARVA
jgi:hypothetical protein